MNTESGFITISVRVSTLDKADPPPRVIDSSREVQAAEQERGPSAPGVRADSHPYANRVLCGKPAR